MSRAMVDTPSHGGIRWTWPATWSMRSLWRGAAAGRWHARTGWIGRALKGTRVILLVAGRNVRIITTEGRLLRNFELDPSLDYQPHSLG